MKTKLRCPYCLHYNIEPNELFEEDQHYQCECEKCNKIFGYTIEYKIIFNVCKLPCKNGTPHKFEPINNTLHKCKYCGQEIQFIKK